MRDSHNIDFDLIIYSSQMNILVYLHGDLSSEILCAVFYPQIIQNQIW